MNDISEIAEQREGLSTSGPLFRGLGSSEWGLHTTLERSYPLEIARPIDDFPDYYSHVLAAQPAIETLTAQNWGIMLNPNLLIGEMEKFRSIGPQFFLSKHKHLYRYLVYLRHHGYPSPLLDWTASPYIAAFFAFNSMEANAKYVSVVAIVKSAITATSSDKPQVTILGPYIRSHRRHFVQQSRYTICIDWENGFRFTEHDGALDGALGLSGEALRIEIPAKDRTTALKGLDLMNINEYSLFGTDDSLMRTLSRREGLFRSE